MRVEELALQGDVSVDTIRYYQKQGLLRAPARDGRVAWYDAEHLEALARIRDLQRRGLSLAIIRRFVSGELEPADQSLAAAVAEANAVSDPGAGELSLEELADEVGVTVEIVSYLVDDGLLAPQIVDGQPRFTANHLSTLRSGLALVEAGLPLDELLALAHRHHTVTSEVAERAVELFDDHVRKPLLAGPLSASEQAEKLVAAFDALLPAVTGLVADHFRRLLLEAATNRFEHPAP